ncbi:tetratricopeptide repeat protein [Bradymonas sediminis]|uniref:Uncharacterized protein n=1 Tax=Bradymonas sediminis TaxID=1548548 RepID=A0A2Z4FML7_9DELT|nr:tetratricopeptide repeat protein [Bradymonas sediminis]AWV90193.1 hypothetical protein DN745_12960 [Bradymonas sediminis]TDP75839.1 tetratricopeptide repeat protein [Bradymonas sediminis]
MNYLNLKANSLRSIVCLASVLVAFSAHAQEAIPSHQDLSAAQQQELVDLIDKGQAAFDAGDFAAALASYQDAYALFSHPDLRYRMARCHEYLGELPEAIEGYESFLAATPDAEERGRIEKTVAALKERHRQTLPATLELVVIPADANVFIDGERVSNLQREEGRVEVELEAGAHDIWVGKRGFSDKRQVFQLSAAESKTLAISLDLADAGAPETASGGVPMGPIILGSVGVVSGVIGVVSYTQYASDREQIDQWDAQKGQQTRPADYDSTYDAMNTSATLTWASGVVSVASLATAAIWWWGFGDETPTPPAYQSGIALDSVTFTPDPSQGNAAPSDARGLFMRGRF